MNRFYKGDTCGRCSKPLTIKNKSGYCRSCRMLGNTITLGRVMPTSEKRHLASIRLGKDNPNWRGDNVGISALHGWVKAHLKKAELCERCYTVPPYDLANKGIYNRDFSNWEWLCRRCHMKSDGRLERFREYGKNRSSR